MSDFITELRRATLVHLKANQRLLDIVPKASIYPSTVPASPTWPFTRWDAPQSTPFGFGCTTGAQVSFFVHAFAKERKNGAGSTIETAEDHCGRIAVALKIALHRKRLAIGDGSARLLVRSVRLMIDGAEKDAYHAVVDIVARIYQG